METEGSIRSVLYLQPKNNDYEAVIEFMKRERVTELSRENGGFLGGSFNIPTSRKGPLLVLATWAHQSDYERWLSSPVRESMRPKLEPLLDGTAAGGEMYVVARDLPA
jgi:hypothetical protein